MINSGKKSLENLIANQYSNITSMIILKDHQLLFEYYAEECNPNTTTHIASVTKSVISTLIGIVIEKGLIESVDDKVLDYFPCYKLKRGEKKLSQITIRHLLTMTAPYKYKSEPYTKVYSSKNWTISALDLLGGKGNIGEFKYTTVGIQILAGIITNVTNQSVRNFANEYLFKPLNINVSNDIKIETKDEYMSFIKKGTSNGWVVDPNDVNAAGWGLTLTAMDMVKLGLLHLDKGIYQNKRIISADWVNQSTTTHSYWGNRPYGFLWWIINEKMGTYAAIGDNGNIIYVSTKKNMVIAITSSFMPRAKDRVEFISKHIEPLY